MLCALRACLTCPVCCRLTDCAPASLWPAEIFLYNEDGSTKSASLWNGDEREEEREV